MDTQTQQTLLRIMLMSMARVKLTVGKSITQIYPFEALQLSPKLKNYFVPHASCYSDIHQSLNRTSLCNEKNVYNTCLEWGCSLCNQTRMITKWLVAGIRTGRQSRRSNVCVSVRGCYGTVHRKAFYLLTLAMLMKGEPKRPWFLKAPKWNTFWTPENKGQDCFRSSVWEHMQRSPEEWLHQACAQILEQLTIFFLQRSWRKWEKDTLLY